MAIRKLHTANPDEALRKQDALKKLTTLSDDQLLVLRHVTFTRMNEKKLSQHDGQLMLQHISDIIDSRQSEPRT